MTQVKWKFKGIDLYFVSDKEKLTRDVLRHRGRLGTKAKIEIINDYFTLSESDLAGCASCSRNGLTKSQSTLPVYTEEDPTESDAVHLFGVSGDVDSTDSAGDLFSDGPSTSDDNSTGDSVDSEPIG
jgi:hypothetical protein